MKRRIEVITTKVFDIEIPDEKCTPEFIAEFESYMFKLKNGVDSLFEFAAEQLADGQGNFIEGIGEVSNSKDKPDAVKFKEDYWEVESQIIEEKTGE